MIFDGFIFYNELDLLEIRLHELAGVVDHFVLVESTKTFTNKPKPLHFADGKDRFAPFLDKIIHVVVDDMPDGNDHWARESHQRNAILRGLVDATDTDHLIMTDVDEIPRASVVKDLAMGHETTALEMSSFGGFLNCRTGLWPWGRIGVVKDFRDRTPQVVRHSAAAMAPNAGWHFSSVGGAKMVAGKFDAFSHQEPSVQQYNNASMIAAFAPFGRGILGGMVQCEEIDNSYPAHLVANLPIFSHLIGSLRPYSPYVPVLVGGDLAVPDLDWVHHMAKICGSAVYVGSEDDEAWTAIERSGCATISRIETLTSSASDMVLLGSEEAYDVADALTAAVVFAGLATKRGIDYAENRFGKVDRVGALWSKII